MKWRVLELLRCPECGDKLAARADTLACVLDPQRTVPSYMCSDCHRPEGRDCPQCFTEEVQQGELRCPGGHVYAIEHAVPRFYGQACPQPQPGFTFYQDSLGGTDKQDPECFWKLLLPPGASRDFFRSKLVLDIGCGDALFDQTLDKLGQAEIVASDIDPIVYTTAERRLANIHLLRASADALPLIRGRFDFVFSVYALHYLADMPTAMDIAARQVAPGGWLTLSLYPRRDRLKEGLSRALRTLLTPLNAQVRRTLLLGMVPFVGAAGGLSGVSLRRDGWRRCRDLLEAYFGPPHLHAISTEELLDWFGARGFLELVVGPHPVTVCGRLPQ